MNILLTFTYGMSLEQWNNKGIIYREISLYKILLKENITYRFLTFGTKRDLSYSDITGNIKITPSFNILNSRIPKFHFIKSLFLPLKLKRIFKEVDIIKTNQIRGSWIACVAKILYNKKLIIRGGYEWLNRYSIDYLYNKKISYIKYLLNYFWIFINELIAYKLADGIILTNEEDISFIIKCFKLKRKYKKNKILHLSNFIDVDLFKPLSVPKLDKRVLFIGNLKGIKNLKNLLKAFQHLKKFGLDIIGKGPDEEKLRKQAQNLRINVNFLGIIPNSKIPEIINQYRIFILPSYYEGNPKVLLEAMSCGCACIGTDVHGINTIIKHKENGYLCKTHPNSIREAILTLYNNDNLIKKIGKNARSFILNNCSLRAISQKEYLFYKEILNN